MMIVNNISDKFITEKARKEWLEYWLHFSVNKQKYCSEVNCIASHEHGVLVQTFDEHAKTYVIPLCKAHSENFNHQLEIADTTEVIPADLTL